MGLLTRYFTREILAYIAGIFILILSVFLVQRTAQLLAELTEAALPIGVMAKLLALRTLMALPSLLPSVVYLAVLLAMMRLNENHELEAMRACGISRVRIYRSVAPLALVAAAVIAVLAIYGRPWAAKRYLHTKAVASVAAGTDQMRPGRFYELDWGGEQVFFAKRRSKGKPSYLEDVFLQQRLDGTLSIHFAARALEQRDVRGNRRVLAFYDGRRYDFPLDSADQEITEYAEFMIAFPLPEPEITLEEEEMAVTALWRSPEPSSSAELQWRLAMPFSTLVLVLMALALCPEHPERAGVGMGARVFVALLSYVVYRQILGTGKSWIVDGTLPPTPGLLAIHGLFFALAVAVLLQRSARLHGSWGALLAALTSNRVLATPNGPGGAR